MATTIDIENAKQIRQPMDVVIEMNVPDTSVTLTYSGYFTTSKISDGELDEPTWPMRGLADLQGQGFPLDGSRELYDSGVTPSEANGKIGVRGNIGESVNVTVRGNKTITSLFVHVTGAESITFGSTTTPIINNVVTIPVGATSITLTLNPASATERIEISEIGAGARFSITNENLIRATVSLRADLSIINPTLPESELNVEVYQDTDVSEAVAAIPEDTPITYSAGYPGDMSPTRKFYVTGQVTWADNVLSIQAVDAVHLLDVNMVPAFYGRTGMSTLSGFELYTRAAVHGLTGVDLGDYEAFFNYYDYEKRDVAIFPDDVTVREMIATAMNVLRWETVSTGYFYQGTPATRYVFDYIDAGAPTLRTVGNPPMWAIAEEDCGEITSNVERKITEITYAHDVGAQTLDISQSIEAGTKFGSASWVKGLGVSLSIEVPVWLYAIGLKSTALDFGDLYESLVPAARNGIGVIYGLDAKTDAWFSYLNQNEGIKSGFSLLSTSAVHNGDYVTLPGQYGQQSAAILSQFIEWSVSFPNTPSYSAPYGRTQTQVWNELVRRGVIQPGANEIELDIFGIGIRFSSESQNVTASGVAGGIKAEYEIPIKGRSYFANSSGAVQSEAFPRSGMNQLTKRSNKTGSFKWKGDPRMQPRDNATITMRDGTQKVVTLENITLTHEGGGLSAEITYREGAV